MPERPGWSARWPPHINTHTQLTQSPNTEQMPKHCLNSCSCETTNSWNGAQTQDENFYTADELWCFLSVLPNWTQTWQRYEVVQKEFFLACIPQGNAGCQGKSINSHAKMIRSIVLACCTQVGKCPIYSYGGVTVTFQLSCTSDLYSTWRGSHSGEVAHAHIQQIWFICLWDDSSLLHYSLVQSLCHNPSDLYINKKGVICYLLKKNLSLHICTHTK